jgi:glutamate dehydrogenase
VLARLHFIVTTPAPKEVDIDALTRRLAAAARSWGDALTDSLLQSLSEEQANQQAARWSEAFPASYREHFTPEHAVADIALADRAMADGIAVQVYRAPEDGGEAGGEVVRFKIAQKDRPVPLSDGLPMLEGLGVRVMEERPFPLTPAGGPPVWLQDFRLICPSDPGGGFDLGAVRARFEDAFLQVWRGEVDNDGFNRLVLRAKLAAREVAVLRTYGKYLRQAGIPFSQPYMEQTLAANPTLAAGLIALFHARFDPKLDRREWKVTAARQAVEDALEKVQSLDEDRILRRFLNLVLSTLRTNFYQGKPYLSFKLDSRNVQELPAPRPHVEIWVRSPRVEAIHLRGGPVSRGGIRWSDRREDFRTEILGLLKAQMVKNAVIVPVGAKGGFVPQRPPMEQGREAVQADGVECYQTLIRGLLDVTDNLEKGRVVAPPDVVRHDGDDPYLVVAADKGTATFSDIANAVAREYGFWLDDAFASGGSAGYDHKKMAITAKGAWEAVKRHFRELGRDIQVEPFSVVGIGDMSGDVFGNGMLLSEHTRLIAAFDHRHVFVDPDPDPATSFAERKRLFDLPRSSWADYDRAKLSKGGGIYERTTKSIELSPEAKARLGLNGARVTPIELMRAVLLADVDLLWNGGIGTYVKAADESHIDVGDRANDAIRVDGKELKAKVVGEGGNLGFTQKGRIEYANAGGKLNTDAVDNSAGVDTSDHEVNIKVLLGAIVADGEMTLKQRDRLLADMTDEVGGLVLQDNYLQTQAIGIAESLGLAQTSAQARLIHELERTGRLDRMLEALPEPRALLTRGKALTRPELAVLMAYAKTTLYTDLLDGGVAEDAYLANDLMRYFPRPLRAQFAGWIEKHPLRREIIATRIANSIVNRAGSTFVHAIVEETGDKAPDIARAYTIARDAFALRPLWAEIEALDNKVPAATQTRMAAATMTLLERASIWYLRNLPRPIDISSAIAEQGAAITRLASSLDAMLHPSERAGFAERAEGLAHDGVPADLARRVAGLEALVAAPDIVRAARDVGINVALDQVGAVYFAVGARLGLDWLRRAAQRMNPPDAWERRAVIAIVNDMYGQQRALATAVLKAGGATEPEAAVSAWAAERAHGVDRLRALTDEFHSSGSIDLARLAIVNRHMNALIGMSAAR